MGSLKPGPELEVISGPSRRGWGGGGGVLVRNLKYPVGFARTEGGFYNDVDMIVCSSCPIQPIFFLVEAENKIIIILAITGYHISSAHFIKTNFSVLFVAFNNSKLVIGLKHFFPYFL